MKIIALLSLVLSISAFAARDCEEFKQDNYLYKACLNDEIDQDARYIVPEIMLFCSELHEFDSIDYWKCVEGEDLTHKSWKPDPQLCLEKYGYNTHKFNACMNGTLDEQDDLSLPMEQCRKACAHAYDFDQCYKQVCQGPM